jgi:ABC-type dipeptide/oligopeptide/nickel transport system ATPase subunit
MPSSLLLEVRNLSKTYQRRPLSTAALHDVSFTLEAGRTLAIVGPSGSGKSTLARCLASFETPTAGEIVFQGRPLEIQLISQQPAASLNPRFTAAEVIEEPLLIQRRGSSAGRRQSAARAMEQVGLSPADLGKRSQQFSGGELQRLAIARALVLEPKLIILDESLTGLDVALQTQITGLLRALQARLGITYILISHDLALAAGLATKIAVMDHGAIVEHASAAELLAAPRHPLTRELLAATRALTV